MRRLRVPGAAGHIHLPGAECISALACNAAYAARADVALIGEGRFDATSLTGNLVGHLVSMATGATIGATKSANCMPCDCAARLTSRTLDDAAMCTPAPLQASSTNSVKRARLGYSADTTMPLKRWHRRYRETRSWADTSPRTRVEASPRRAYTRMSSRAPRVK